MYIRNDVLTYVLDTERLSFDGRPTVWICNAKSVEVITDCQPLTKNIGDDVR